MRRKSFPQSESSSLPTRHHATEIPLPSLISTTTPQLRGPLELAMIQLLP